jgi:hypothetical protein
MDDGTLAVACGAAGDPGNDCGSRPAMDDGTLAVACDAAGGPGTKCLREKAEAHTHLLLIAHPLPMALPRMVASLL